MRLKLLQTVSWTDVELGQESAHASYFGITRESHPVMEKGEKKETRTHCLILVPRAWILCGDSVGQVSYSQKYAYCNLLAIVQSPEFSLARGPRAAGSRYVPSSGLGLC